MTTRTEEARRRVGEFLARRIEERAAAQRRERLAIRGALFFFAAGTLLVFASVDQLLPIPWWAALLAVIAFQAMLILGREKKTAARVRLDLQVGCLERMAARLEDQWSFGQDDGRRFLDPDHAFAADLDVLGEASLFMRVNATHTGIGRVALAAILTGKDRTTTPHDLQSAVRELAADAAWLEAWEAEMAGIETLAGPADADRLQLEKQTEEVIAWGETTPAQAPSRIRVVATLALAAQCVGTLVIAALGLTDWGLFTLAYILNFVVLARAEGLKEAHARFESVERTLGAWSRAFAMAERSSHAAPPLRAARTSLADGPHRASAAIARLSVLAERLGQMKNLFWTLTAGVVILIDLHTCRLLNAWHRRHGKHLRAWFDAVAHLEALNALAIYAAASPDDAWSGESREPAVFEARGLVHPLLPRSTRVANDFRIDAPGSAAVITGSNMSGKSTLLRAAGLAVVMSNAGLPVAATAFSHRPLEVVTSMRVQDSLARGSSRFHAEILRLKRCVDAAGTGPTTLVLLDEILAGTNSVERHAGTLAVVRHLLELDAATLIATHDLALAGLAEEFRGRITLAHFQEQVEGGTMSFDFRLRDGTCATTNALRLLRSAGLVVDEPHPA